MFNIFERLKHGLFQQSGTTFNTLIVDAVFDKNTFVFDNWPQPLVKQPKMYFRRTPASQENSSQKHGPPYGLLSFSSISSLVNDLNTSTDLHPSLYLEDDGFGKPKKLGCLDLVRNFMAIDLVWIFKNLCEN